MLAVSQRASRVLLPNIHPELSANDSQKTRALHLAFQRCLCWGGRLIMGELLRRCKGTLLAPGVFAGGGGVAVHTSGFLQSVAALPGAQQVPGWGKQPSGK